MESCETAASHSPHPDLIARALSEFDTWAHPVANAMGSTTRALSTVRRKLLDRGLIYATEDYDYIDFTVPRIDEFMRRHMPFRRPPRPNSRPHTKSD